MSLSVRPRPQCKALSSGSVLFRLSFKHAGLRQPRPIILLRLASHPKGDSSQSASEDDESCRKHPADEEALIKQLAASGRKWRMRIGQLFLWSNVALVGWLTFDVFSNASLHLFRPLDEGLHVWVTTHVPQASRDLIFDKVVSDFGIAVVLLAWFVVDSPDEKTPDVVAELRHRLRPSNLKLAAVALGVEALATLAKDIFHRARPRADFHSLSFPSGHTLAAVTLGGMFLFFRLYPFLKRRGLDKATPEQYPLRASLLGLWFLIGGMTAAGRIGADAHWLSDTVAGGAIGACTVTTVWLTTRRRNTV